MQILCSFLSESPESYVEVIELKLDACSFIPNFVLVRFDFPFQIGIDLYYTFELPFEYLLLAIEPRGVRDVSSPVVDKAGDFGVIQFALLHRFLCHRTYLYNLHGK